MVLGRRPRWRRAGSGTWCPVQQQGLLARDHHPVVLSPAQRLPGSTMPRARLASVSAQSWRGCGVGNGGGAVTQADDGGPIEPASAATCVPAQNSSPWAPLRHSMFRLLWPAVVVGYLGL